MLTLSVGVETKSKRLRSHRQLHRHRQRLEYRTIGNSFSLLVRMTENDHGLNITMKKLFALPLIIILTIFGGCQKQETEEERNAKIERQVQERLAAEHQAQAEQQVAQRAAELDAREKALAEKQNAAADTPAPETRRLSVPQRMSDASGNPATASYSTFYTKLEPYGVWRETSNYGYVWQPREAEQSRNWRPYTYGRWVYTDAGWTWMSGEPFGWATYHYGRWTRLRNIGWIWVPGDEWAPAWVSWRKSNDYIGWAPLPPEARFDRRHGIHNWADNYYDIGPDQYCFVPTNQFGAQRVERTVVPAERNVTIVNQTTNVTNLTYNNTTIVNEGPNYDELRGRTQRPIERLRLERQTVNVEAETPRAVIKGEVLEAPAPVIARAHSAERPQRLKETVAQAVVDRGWEAMPDRQAAEKLRAKIKSESTPPPDAPPKTFVKPTQAAAEPVAATPAATPAFASPTISATQAPSRPPMATSRQTAPARSPQIPGPSATIAQSATPFRRASPSAIPSLAPTSTPSITATPTARETAPITPQGPLTPRRVVTPTPSSAVPVAPEVSATPSVAPTNSGTTSPSPATDRSPETKNHRKAERESRKQQQAAQDQQKKGELQKQGTHGVETSPRENPTALPLISPTATMSAVSTSPAESSKTEEKKKRKRERDRVNKGPESVSPSPSSAPE
jgi:hypothetical protein